MPTKWMVLRVSASTYEAVRRLRDDWRRRAAEGQRLEGGAHEIEQLTDNDVISTLVKHLRRDNARSSRNGRLRRQRRRQPLLDQGAGI